MSLIDASVKDVMTKVVKTIEHTKTVAESVRIMRDSNVGSIIVVEGTDQKPVGIFTERDLIRMLPDNDSRFLVKEMSQVMSKPVITISPSATVWDAMTLMGQRDIRRLPVVEGAKLVGILTERDVLRLILARQNLLLESVSESLPAATREQLRGLAGRLDLEKPPIRSK